MDCSRVVFVVTGFGPFAGQPTNPTQQLLADVGARLEAINEQLLAYQASVLETHVLEVALEPVDFFHAHLSSMLAKQRAARPVVVCLQFGVDGRSSGIRMERCAYNECTFRVPDQHGNQPQQAPISNCNPLSHPCYTQLDLEALQEQLSQDPDLPPVALSTDPGRFLCNYTYYKSLQLSGSQACPLAVPQLHALFVHVPNHEHVSADRLMAFSLALMRQIARMLTQAAGAHLQRRHHPVSVTDGQ